MRHDGQADAVSPGRAVRRGAVAGLVGTAVMTAVQALEARAAREDGSPPPEPPRAWEDTSEPAQVGQRVITGVFRHPVGLDRAGLLTNTVHWGHGTALGVAYGIASGGKAGHPVRRGLALGAGAWALAYAALGAMGLYEPMWRYPAKTLAGDFGRHAAYGVGTALGYHALAGRR